MVHLTTKNQKEQEKKVLLIEQNLDLELTSILNLKTDLINTQRYEQASELRVVEMKIKDALLDLKEFAKKNHT